MCPICAHAQGVLFLFVKFEGHIPPPPWIRPSRIEMIMIQFVSISYMKTKKRYVGPLMGGPQCRLWILKNGNVPCHFFGNFPVYFKTVQCCPSILRNGNVPCHYFLNFPVGFKIV